MIDAGVDLYVIGKIVGHTNATMTERYGHLVKGRDNEAVEKLPDWERKEERGFCPSCSAKRATLWAEFVREQVIRPVPHRHQSLRASQDPAAGIPVSAEASSATRAVRLEGGVRVPPRRYRSGHPSRRHRLPPDGRGGFELASPPACPGSRRGLPDGRRLRPLSRLRYRRPAGPVPGQRLGPAARRCSTRSTRTGRRMGSRRFAPPTAGTWRSCPITSGRSSPGSRLGCPRSGGDP